MIISIQDFLDLRSTLPMVDVRSELEYQQGHIHGAINLPLLNNAERVAVGTDYKRKGQQEAIKTGFRLVGPRLSNIIEDARQIGNELLVHCWRGGMRSSNFGQFMNMARIKTHQLKGGYKAYRQLAMDSFKSPFQFVVIGGCTGSGKSEILNAVAKEGEQVIDLENLAHHKGSAFGGLMMPPQPTTEQFQNDLFEEILKLDLSKKIWIEDESLGIGKIFLPEEFWNVMSSSALVEVDVPKETGVMRLVNEYGMADKHQFLEAMAKITKKLGGQHFNAAREKLLAGDMSSVITILLTYYDKAYRNGLEKKKNRIKLHSAWNGTDVQVYAQQLIKEVNSVSTFVR